MDRALTELQADFKILPVGVTKSGAWHYAFAYDLVHRHFPKLPGTARFIRSARRAAVWRVLTSSRLALAQAAI